MSKHVTAIFRTHAVAAEAKAKIEGLGIPGRDVTIVPDDPAPVAAGTHRHDDHVGLIDRLNLPDDDQRTYRRAVREGNFVVSAKVDDDDHIAAVEDALRHPEHAIDIDAYDAQYRTHPDYAADLERDRALAARESVYTRDTARTGPYARTYY